MSVRPCARSTHFMVHHLSTPPDLSGKAASESPCEPVEKTVDNSVERAVDDFRRPAVLRLGLVVPKRHARRAVTRTLVKNQLRDAIRRHLPHLASGDWVLRLRAPIDRSRFPSARSEALAEELRGEIERLLADAARRVRRAALPPSS